MGRPHPLFKQRDAARLVRAFVMAGVGPPVVRVTKTGELIAIPAAATPPAADDLDHELEEFKARHGEG